MSLSVSGGGGAMATSPPPQYLLTYSYKDTPLTLNNTVEHIRTSYNSIRVHRIHI